MILGLMRAAALVLAFAVAAPAPAAAAWRDDFKVLRVGIVAVNGAAYDIARLQPFRRYLEGWLGVPVEIVATASYDALIDAQVSARVQYAIHSAASYVTTQATCDCVDPIALPAAFDGSRGFHAVLVAHAQGPVASLADAKGKRLALTGEDSVAGHLVPLHALAGEGIDPPTYFSSILSAADPEQAVTMLFTGEADLAAGWSSLAGDPAAGYSFGVFTRMVAEGAVSMDRLRIVWQSPLIPFGPHVVRRDMPEELKTLLGEALGAMAGEAPDVLDAVNGTSIGGGGFVPVTDKDYAVIADLVKQGAGGG